MRPLSGHPGEMVTGFLPLPRDEFACASSHDVTRGRCFHAGEDQPMLATIGKLQDAFLCIDREKLAVAESVDLRPGQCSELCFGALLVDVGCRLSRQSVRLG